jgi:hypothetical protein
MWQWGGGASPFFLVINEINKGLDLDVRSHPYQPNPKLGWWWGWWWQLSLLCYTKAQKIMMRMIGGKFLSISTSGKFAKGLVVIATPRVSWLVGPLHRRTMMPWLMCFFPFSYCYSWTNHMKESKYLCIKLARPFLLPFIFFEHFKVPKPCMGLTLKRMLNQKSIKSHQFVRQVFSL